MSPNPVDVNQPSDKYTVVVRDQPFRLSTAQITFDSPNLFTLSFLGDFAEATSRTLELDGNPDLFAIIVDYLSGYPVLPLSASMLPNRMDLETAIRYLAKDADYLGLTRLQALLATPRRAFQEWAGTMTYGVDMVDLLNDNLPSTVQWAGEPPQLVDVREGGKPVCVIARNVGLRFVKGDEYMYLPQAEPKRINSNIFWITHLEGMESLPLMYGIPDHRAAMTLDGHACILVNDFKSYFSGGYGFSSQTPADRASKHYHDFVTSPQDDRSIWASHAAFSIHGRDILDNVTQWRHWDLRLITARGRTRPIAIGDALFGGES